MKSLQDIAQDYAKTHNDVAQAYIDGYKAAKQPINIDEDLYFVDKPFLEPMELWLRYKRERKQRYTSIGAHAAYRRLLQLSNNNPSTAMAIVEQSIANNYQGLFPLKNEKFTSSYTNDKRQQSIDRLAELASGVLSSTQSE